MSILVYSSRDFIPLPGRSVQTFPSGLVRVERSFACRRSAAPAYRELLRVGDPMPEDDGSPAIDGLYIFPEPQEQDRGDGFVEFRVTAYGRTRAPIAGRIDRQTIRSNYLLTIIDSPGANQPERVREFLPASINTVYTRRAVFSTSEPTVNFLQIPPGISPLVMNTSGVQFVAGTTANPSTQTTLSLVLENFTSTDFGQWVEISATWKSMASVVQNFIPN